MSLAFLFGNIIDTVFFISIIVGIVFILLWYVASKIISKKRDNDYTKKQEEIKPFEEAKEEIKPFLEAKDEISSEEENVISEDVILNEEKEDVIENEINDSIDNETEAEFDITNEKTEDDINDNSSDILKKDAKTEELENKVEEIKIENENISLFDEDESNEPFDVEKEDNKLLNDEKDLDKSTSEDTNEELKKTEDTEKKEELENNLTEDSNEKLNTLDDIETFDDVKEDLETKEEKKPLKKLTGVIPVKKGRSYNGKYEIFQVADGYQYRLKASNGEILVQSETFISHDGVIKAIDAVKRNLETGEVKIYQDKHDNYKFKLTSKNYRVLAISGGYSVEKSAIRASESFKKFAFKADIVDVDVVENEVIASTIDVKKETTFSDAIFIYEKYGGEYSWALEKDNKILCQDEGYTTKNGVLYAIDTFKRNVSSGVFKCISCKDMYCFRLYNQANRVCAIGEMYKTKEEVYDAVQMILNCIDDASLKEKK